jgi:hypothetical protein
MVGPTAAKETLHETLFARRNDLPIHDHIILTASPGRHRRLETQPFLYQRNEPRRAIPVSSGLTVDNFNLHDLIPSLCRPSALRPFSHYPSIPQRSCDLVGLTAVGHPLSEILTCKAPFPADAHGGDFTLTGKVVDRPAGHSERPGRALNIEDFLVHPCGALLARWFRF